MEAFLKALFPVKSYDNNYLALLYIKEYNNVI
jgi:hypothetical protein